MALKLKDILLSPWYAIEILTGEKSFSNNPIIGSEALNRRGLHVWRVKAAAGMVNYRRRKLEHLVAPADRQAYAEYGYIEKRNLVPADQFRQLVAEIESLQVPAREMYEGNAVTRRTPLTPEVVAKLPAVKAFLESPEWTNLIRYIGGFDVEPVISVQTIFADASTKGKGQGSADQSAHGYLPLDRESLVLPARCSRRGRAVHLREGVAQADPTPARLAQAQKHPCLA